MNHILLVEDDAEISEMISTYLLGENCMIDTAHTGKYAQALFLKNNYDLILLDLMLPDKSGMEIIKEIRNSSTIPIIIVTAKDNDTDKSMGLNLGADDYITKPFSLIELSARIRANIRRATNFNPDKSSEKQLSVKNLFINIDEHTATLKGKPLHLTYTEFEILYILAKNPGKAFSKEQLYDLIWKEPYLGNENVLNTHINRLRSKLSEISPEGKNYIKTLWGIGYKMEG